MTPDQFIAKWQANRRGERQAAHEHFIDLCGLLGEPTPNTDPDGSTYAFEKGASKATGAPGWADVWRKGCFAWEYKGKHKDLDAARRRRRDDAGRPVHQLRCSSPRALPEPGVPMEAADD